MKTFLFLAPPSPHVKSGVFAGQMKSIWRAMTGPIFDFQGDLHQQGGAIIAGPGKLSLLLLCHDVPLSLHHVKSQFFPLTQVHRYIFAILIPIASTTCPSTGSSSSLEFSRHWISASQRSSTCRERAFWICGGFFFHMMSIAQIMCSYWLYKLDIYNKSSL